MVCSLQSAVCSLQSANVIQRKIVNFFMAIVCITYDWSESSKHTHTDTKLKMEFKDILFRKLPFSRSMLSLCENENTPIRGKRIAP